MESFEQPKLKYLILDFSAGEPVVLDQLVTDNPDLFMEEFEQKTGKKFDENPQFVLATEDPNETPE